LRNKKIHQSGPLSITKLDQLSPEFLAQIQRTILGQIGQLRYRLVDAETKANHIKNASFIELKLRDKLIGTVALVSQKVTVNQAKSDYLYVRYFSIHGLLRSRLGQPFYSTQKKSSIIRRMLKETFSSMEDIRPDEQSYKGIYAYIADTNAPSIKNALNMGFQRVGSFETLLISRINPRPKVIVEQLTQDEFLPLMSTRLQSQYDLHDFVPDWSTFFETRPAVKYIVTKSAGEIICGAAISLAKWEIKEYPGFTGWLTRNLLSRVPYLKRIFFDNELHFLTVEATYHRNEDTETLLDLIESALHQNDLHHAMCWFDVKDERLKQLKNTKKLGLLHRLRKPASAGFFIKKYDHAPENCQCLYISAEGIS
jgi:hypothetical protein